MEESCMDADHTCKEILLIVDNQETKVEMLISLLFSSPAPSRPWLRCLTCERVCILSLFSDEESDHKGNQQSMQNTKYTIVLILSRMYI